MTTPLIGMLINLYFQSSSKCCTADEDEGKKLRRFLKAEPLCDCSRQLKELRLESTTVKLRNVLLKKDGETIFSMSIYIPVYLVSLSSCWQPSITLTKQPISCKSLKNQI